MDSRESQQINLPSEFLRRGPYVCLHIWEKHATGVRLHCFCQVPVFLVLTDISVWVTPAVLVIVTWGLWAHDESAAYISMIPDEHTSSKHHSAIADGSYHVAWTTRRGFIHYSFYTWSHYIYYTWSHQDNLLFKIPRLISHDQKVYTADGTIVHLHTDMVKVGMVPNSAKSLANGRRKVTIRQHTSILVQKEEGTNPIAGSLQRRENQKK